VPIGCISIRFRLGPRSRAKLRQRQHYAIHIVDVFGSGSLHEYFWLYPRLILFALERVRSHPHTCLLQTVVPHRTHVVIVLTSCCSLAILSKNRPREAVPNVYPLACETLSDNSERHGSLKIIPSGWKDGDEEGLYDDTRTNCVRPFVMELWRVQNFVVDQRAMLCQITVNKGVFTRHRQLTGIKTISEQSPQWSGLFG
jgi:hypothetical protein